MQADYRIFFTVSEFRHPDVAGPAIVFAPDSDPWNDFGLRTRFNYRLLTGDPGASVLNGSVHLGLREKGGSSADDVVALLRTKKDTLLEAKDVGPFFTLHQSLQDYRNIVSKLGVEEAQRALRTMNDLVLLTCSPETGVA